MTTPLIIDPRKVTLSEQDIEDWLYENPGTVCSDYIYEVQEWIGRQYRLPSGIADLIGVDQRGFLVVVEVKNVEINKAAILQVCRYALDVQEIAQSRMGYPKLPSRNDGSAPFVRRVVVGPSVDGQTYYEALSCDVDVITFRVALELSVSQTRWTQEYYRDRQEQLGAISRGVEWLRYGEHIDDYVEPDLSFWRVGDLSDEPLHLTEEE